MATREFKAIFDGVGMSLTVVGFIGILGGRKLWIFNVVPGDSNIEQGLYYYVFINRLAQFLGVDEEEAKVMLPNVSYFEPWKGAQAYRGYFKTVDDVKTLVAKLSGYRQ